MAIGSAPNTTWVQVTASASPLSGVTSVPCGRGVALKGDGEFSVGTRNSITHKANADTDGFPVPADTVFEVPPAMWADGTAPNLNALYAIAAGNVNVWVIYPKG